MKKIFCFVLMVVLLPMAVWAGLDSAAVARQEIKVTLVPDKHLLQGESVVTFTPGASRVFLNLSSAAAIDAVSLAGGEARYSFNGGALAIDIPEAARKQPAAVHIAYHISFGSAPPGNPANTDDPTYGVTGIISPEGVFLGSDAGWYPAPQVTPAFRTIEVSAPAGVEAITSGKRILRETKGGISRSVWEEKRPVGELAISAGPYRIQERHADGVDIYTYLYPENTGLADRYLDAAVKYIRMYSELFGPYPFDKFAAVENFFPTGYGYPSYTLLGSAVIRLPFIPDTSFPHEIAHCWWGNGVRVDYREGNWSEGLATYVADYFLEEKKSAVAAKDYRLRLLGEYAALVKPDHEFPLSRFIGRMDPASRAIGYGKAAMVFHMVRMKIGDKAFFNALKAIVRDKVYQTATWSDFTRAFSRASGRDLGPFMKQWLTRSGGPHLSFDHVTRRRKGGGWQVAGAVVQKNGGPYTVMVPVRIETDKGAVMQQVPLTGKKTPFSFPVRYRPGRLVLDPDAQVFRILSAEELPPTVNMLKGAENLAVVVSAGCRAAPQTLKTLLQSLGKGEARFVDEKDLKKTDLSRSDLLVCGMPDSKTLPLVFPAGISPAPGEFSVEGERYAEPQDLLLVVTENPYGAGHMAALFLPLSAQAADLYAPKITHYGKYGYLVFSGGQNKRKGLLSPAANTVEFSGQ